MSVKDIQEFEFKIPYEWKNINKFNSVEKIQEHARQFAIFCKEQQNVNYETIKVFITEKAFRQALFLICEKGKKQFPINALYTGQGKHILEKMFNTYISREEFDEFMLKYCPDIERRCVEQTSHVYKMKIIG